MRRALVVGFAGVAGIVVAALVLVLFGTGGSHACTLVGFASRLTVDVTELTDDPPVVVCVDGDCTRADAASTADPWTAWVPVKEGGSTTREVSIRDHAAIELVPPTPVEFDVVRPNGPDCDPDGRSASVRVTADRRLVADPA